METSYMESRRACLADVRRNRHCVNEPGQTSEGADRGNGKPAAEAHVKASLPDRAEASNVDLHTHMTATDLAIHLVRAINVRTHGQVQALRVQILGGRIVLSGFAGSYYAIQLAVVGLQETLDALGLDRPGRVDLDIDVMPSRPARP